MRHLADRRDLDALRPHLGHLDDAACPECGDAALRLWRAVHPLPPGPDLDAEFRELVAASRPRRDLMDSLRADLDR